jgi:DNA-binding transcriptional LysR family regulator
MTHLDSDLLRTFLAIAEAGSVTGGADRISRSQSATSLQVRHLEEIVGQPLFRRHGRGVVLTAVGERLLPVARRVTHSLDTTLAELRGEGLSGRLRIGLPDDHGRTVLPRIVADFANLHPDVELEVHCALGASFKAALEQGKLDLAVHDVAVPDRRAEVLRKESLIWLAARHHGFAEKAVLPVAVFDRECWWRNVALSSLKEAGRRYRIVFSSESVSGVRSAVASGMAAGLLSESANRQELAILPSIKFRQISYLVMETTENAKGPVCNAMRDAIRKAFRAEDITACR